MPHKRVYSTAILAAWPALDRQWSAPKTRDTGAALQLCETLCTVQFPRKPLPSIMAYSMHSTLLQNDQ